MKDDEARRAAVSLLRRGLITAAEAAKLAGVSRQLVHYWVRDVRRRQVRHAIIIKLWRRELRRGRLVERRGRGADKG